MMKVLFDVDVVVDLLAERSPYSIDVLKVMEMAGQKDISCYLYTGSVQAMHYGLAQTIRRGDESFPTALTRAARIIHKAEKLFQWWSALSEDGSVFSDEDPEGAQLVKAARRMGHDAMLLTRNTKLLERCKQAVLPADFLAEIRKDNRVTPVPFCDLAAQLNKYRSEMERAIVNVVESTEFINGPAVSELEEDLSQFTGVPHTLTCSSGTDALLLPMMAWGIGPGDEVIVPAFTFIATASMVAFLGAKPVFVDIEPVTFTINPEKIEEKITSHTKAIIAVSLYGQCADMDAINAIAARYGIHVIEDAAQSFGATYKGRRSCSLSEVATTSFFPAKPLGGYGDGGAVFTSDGKLAETMGFIKNHGQIKRYNHKYVGINGRMDTLQAAIVNVKLRHFEEELELRQKAADAYTERLSGLVKTPVVLAHNTSSWAQYTIRLEIHNRDAVQAVLKEKGIPTAVHYPIPLVKQEAFKPYSDGSEYPVSDNLSRRVLSLPMHALLTENEIEVVTQGLKDVL